jgi:hypothetical protein
LLGPPTLRHLDRPIAVPAEGLVPNDNFHRHLDAKLDLSFVRDWVADLYAEGGRPSVDPVVFWKLQLVLFFWRWRSRTRLGRPRLSAEVRALIASISRENPLWGTERIRGELLKLGLVVSNRSIRPYRWRGHPRPPSPTWRAFLANHRPRIWAADFFVVHTLTFRTLHVLFFIAHGRRELAHFAVMSHPTAAWVWRQYIEATPGERPRATSSGIATPPSGRTSASGLGGWAQRPSGRRSGRRGRTPSRSGWWGRSGGSAWTT